jgi:hypothetical protein
MTLCLYLNIVIAAPIVVVVVVVDAIAANYCPPFVVPNA